MSEFIAGMKIENVCCQGYAWEVLSTIVSVWGICENPDCPEPDNISHKDPDDLEELTLTQPTINALVEALRLLSLFELTEDADLEGVEMIQSILDKLQEVTK